MPHTPEASSCHAVVKLTNGRQLEIQTPADSNIGHVGKQVQIEQHLDLILCRADGSPEFNDDVNVGDLLRTGHVMAFECSVTALETQIGLLESPGCNHIRH